MSQVALGATAGGAARPAWTRPAAARFLAAAAALWAATAAVPAQTTSDAPAGRAAAVVDLRTAEGAGLVRAAWRTRDARIVEVDHRAPGPDLKPSGAPTRTHDIKPHAGAADFDDSGWTAIEPETLETRRGTGRLSFVWYRSRLTLPDRVGALATAGATVVFEIVVDDYAEIWVDGRLPVVLGQAGGPLIKGFNAPNRVVLTRDARPGQTFQIAVLGINGPISSPPGNFVWVRSAVLEFFPPQEAGGRVTVPLEVRRHDPALDALVPPGTVAERIATGFEFTEGPVWVPDGHLLFSDPNRNRIHRWSPDGQVSVFRSQSGYSGPDIGAYHQPGSNGLALDPEGRLTINEHGNRRVTRLEKNGRITVLADRFRGRRLNSPNDLVYRSDGTLYFTDPPFGLPRVFDDPGKELAWSGVFRVKDGRVELLAKDLAGPNGLAFSPDERHLYVTNWDVAKKVVMRYPVLADGRLGAGEVFFDMTGEPGEQALDGVKVDVRGNLYVAGPGGVRVLSPDGRHLGTLTLPEQPANFAFGDDDGRTLYLTARTGVYRVRLGVPGIRPGGAGAPASTGGTGAVAAGRPVDGGPAAAPSPSIFRADPRFDAPVPPGATLERLAGGLSWVEGPVWDPAARALLFSDIPANAVYRWREGEGIDLFLRPSGYSGTAKFTGREPGSNGLTLDPSGRLVLCQHGDRRIARLESDGRLTTLADGWRGRRLNSPNDAVYDRVGNLYFTDPPFGLPQAFFDPAREIDFSGVYRLDPAGRLALLTSALSSPNGLALSPDEKTLYVSNADAARPVVMAYPLDSGGALGPGRVLFDASDWMRRYPGSPDGIKVDRAGNLFLAGPGGVHVIAPDGTHLGSLITGVATSNCAWGGDGSTLYVTADTAVYRVRLAASGAVPHLAASDPLPNLAAAAPPR
jgi:gluconolactonase